MPPEAKTCADIPELVLPDFFEEAGQNVLATGKGRLLAVNDMERLSGKEPAVLIAGLHRTAQSNPPVVFPGAGLPGLSHKAGDAKPYAERLFLFVRSRTPPQLLMQPMTERRKLRERSARTPSSIG